MNEGQRSGVKYPPGMGSVPPESKLKELLLPPPIVGLKMGVLGTTAALTVAERERERQKNQETGYKGISGSRKGIRTLQSLVEPSCISPFLPFAAPLPQRGPSSTRKAKQRSCRTCCGTYRAGAPAGSPLRAAW